jgi:hypothetical protein
MWNIDLIIFKCAKKHYLFIKKKGDIFSSNQFLWQIRDNNKKFLKQREINKDNHDLDDSFPYNTEYPAF